MGLIGIIDRIDEMGFKCRTIIDKLRALQAPINSHTLKIIVCSDAEQVPHWKRKLIASGNDLAAMQLRGFRGVTPMGFALAWNGLYREPFEGAEDRVLEFKLGQIEREYRRLRILFLRPGLPGKIISDGGDIDNRLKTLFDALRAPKSGELPNPKPPGDGVISCLLEDDSLITGFDVETDQILGGAAGGGRPIDPAHVRLVVKVTVKNTKSVMGYGLMA